MFGSGRQAVYQEKIRREKRIQELALIKAMVDEIRRKMPQLGTRKLYYLLQGDFKITGIKIGKDDFFNYLRSERMLIKLLKSYTKTTHSKHWLKKHSNLMVAVRAKRPEEYFINDLTYVKSRERTHYLSLVSDSYSRKIMEFKLTDDMAAENVVKALEIAINGRENTWNT